MSHPVSTRMLIVLLLNLSLTVIAWSPAVLRTAAEPPRVDYERGPSTIPRFAPRDRENIPEGPAEAPWDRTCHLGNPGPFRVTCMGYDPLLRGVIVP